MARAIALEVINCLEIIPTSPIEVLEPEDTKLLSMTMTQAADYWQIKVPIKARKHLKKFKKNVKS